MAVLVNGDARYYSEIFPYIEELRKINEPVKDCFSIDPAYSSTITVKEIIINELH